MITEPVFEALFEDYDFAKSNPSREITEPIRIAPARTRPNR